MSTSNRNRIPGPTSQSLMRRLRRVESRNVTFHSPTFPVFWQSAKGCQVTDVDANTYLDLTAAFGVMSLGHRAPAVAKAIHRQSASLWHGMGDVHPNVGKVELLETLSRIAPMSRARVILSSSGAEAVESAIKTALLATGKSKIIAFDGAYHGLTLGTLAVTQREDFTTPFIAQTATFAIHHPYPDSLRGPTEMECLDRVERTLKRHRDIGAILVEPMQARGGIRVPPPSFLKSLQILARDRDALLIVDEIYTGLGRTGKTWAVEHSVGVRPDLLCTGKALANGFPMSACLGTQAAMNAWPSSDGEAIHTSTFLGNPLGCAMAIASLRELAAGKWAAKAAAKGKVWLQALRDALGDHPNVGEIRGIGLMIGIELVQDRRRMIPDSARAGRVVSEALRRGLIVLTAGNGKNVLSLTPPLTISLTEMERATTLLTEILYGQPTH